MGASLAGPREGELPPETAGGATVGAAPPRGVSVPAIVLEFALYLAIVVFTYPFLRERFHPVLRALERATAALASALLGPLGSDVSQGGRVLVFDGQTALVVEECTGAYEILIFCAAVLAFPASWRQRLAGFALGIPLIYAVNVLRVAMLLFVGRHWPGALDFLHIYLWQATLILMITGTWLLWIALVVRRGQAAALARPG
jgi:archaeosortase B (VPXXXP-CTERM-specific)